MLTRSGRHVTTQKGQVVLEQSRFRPFHAQCFLPPPFPFSNVSIPTYQHFVQSETIRILTDNNNFNDTDNNNFNDSMVFEKHCTFSCLRSSFNEFSNKRIGSDVIRDVFHFLAIFFALNFLLLIFFFWTIIFFLRSAHPFSLSDEDLKRLIELLVKQISSGIRFGLLPTIYDS